MVRSKQPYSDEMLAACLADGKTVAEGARSAGISERTAYRRMKEAAVQNRINEVQVTLLMTAYGRLSHELI